MRMVRSRLHREAPRAHARRSRWRRNLGTIRSWLLFFLLGAAAVGVVLLWGAKVIRTEASVLLLALLAVLLVLSAALLRGSRGPGGRGGGH
jgi:hypothetical protein